MGDRCIPPCNEADTPHQQTATAADGTHPTGMHSCLSYGFTVLIIKFTNDSVFPEKSGISEYFEVSGNFVHQKF